MPAVYIPHPPHAPAANPPAENPPHVAPATPPADNALLVVANDSNTIVTISGLSITQIASNWVPTHTSPVTLPGDANHDGRVNALDVVAVRAQWLGAGGAGDLNGDGRVNALDIAAIRSHWLQYSPQPSPSASTASSSAAVTSGGTAGGSGGAGGAGGKAGGGSAPPVVIRWPGDANLDNVVNSLDLAAVKAHWLSSSVMGDANADGRVNALDIATIKSHWLQRRAT